MAEAALLDLIRYSKSPLVLVEYSGHIVVISDVLKKIISDKLPYESNLLEMFMHTPKLHREFLSMYNDGKIDVNNLPSEVHVDENTLIYLESYSKLNFEKQNLLLIKFEFRRESDDSFVNRFINSKNLFVHKAIPSLVYGIDENKIIALNKRGSDFMQLYRNEDDLLPENFTEEIENLVEIARVGELSSKVADLNFDGDMYSLKLECSAIDDGLKYFYISFEDISHIRRNEAIFKQEKKRLKNLTEVVPGVLFEFEVDNDELKFTFVSEGIKDILGLSAEHILNDSNLLFSRFDRMERARLHYFFLSLTEPERRVKNEFRINDSQQKSRWVTIDWNESYSENNVLTGTGYLRDISEKKNIKDEQLIHDKRKLLNEYFSLSLLRQPTIPLILNDLTKSLVERLNLQDTVIYLYNHNTGILEYGGGYIEPRRGSNRASYPKTLSPKAGVIGRVVKTQVSEVVANNSKDADYYYLNKPSLSEITVPIIFEGELLGIIDSENVRADFFKDEHLKIIMDVADNLAVRLIQKKRQEDNINFNSTLSTFYQEGKIFDWKVNFKTKKLNNSSVDYLLDIIGVDDKNEKIDIYENAFLLFDYVLSHDVGELMNYINNIRSNKSYSDFIEFRMITNSGEIKWLKLSASKVNVEGDDVESVEGALQDISDLKVLELENKGFELLLSSINVSQLELEKDYDFIKSLGVVGSALGVSRVVVSKFSVEDGVVNYNDSYRWISSSGIYQGTDDCFFKTFEVRDIVEKNTLWRKYYWDLAELDLNPEHKKYLRDHKIMSLLGFPLKTSQDNWGAIYFIVENKRRKWKDYEKNLLSAYATFIALKVQNRNLIEGLKLPDKEILD
ncbi:MAG: GAF domain-containing protein [Bacteroidota bacterium]